MCRRHKKHGWGFVLQPHFGAFYELCFIWKPFTKWTISVTFVIYFELMKGFMKLTLSVPTFWCHFYFPPAKIKLWHEQILFFQVEISIVSYGGNHRVLSLDQFSLSRLLPGQLLIYVGDKFPKLCR